MKTGRSLNELAAEIERQNKAKKDYMGDTRTMKVLPHTEGVDLKLDGKDALPVNELAHNQIAEFTKIPKQYYDRMKSEDPALLANNIETWFKKYPATRMVRTLDKRVRGFMSDKFNRLDNWDFANAILPAILDRKLEVQSCEITEKRLYIKAVDTREVKVPIGYKMGDGSHKIFDVCAPAFIASNSEVGFGQLTLETGVYTKACTNLAWFAAGGMKRRHIGARHVLTDSVEDLESMLSDETKKKTLEALWAQMRDVMTAAFDDKNVAKRAKQLTEAAENKIEQPMKTLELAAERFLLNDSEKESVLKYLINGGKLSQYGLHSAFTRAAQDVADYDRATEMEYMGGKIIELPKSEWQALADA